VFAFFAAVVTGVAAYIQEGRISPLTFALALAMACLSGSVLGLKALSESAARTSRGRSLRWLIVGFLVAALEVPIIIVAANLAPLTAALPLLALPAAIAVALRDVPGGYERLGGAVNVAAILQLSYVLLFSAGMLLQAS
jgi:hypothetical protein